MRIVYATNIRTARVHDFYGPFHRALAQIVNVKLIERELDDLEGRYCRHQTIEGQRNKPLLDPAEMNEYDWVLTDAMYSYMWEDWDKITARKGILWSDQHGPMVRVYVSAAYQRFGFTGFFPLYRDSTRQFHPALWDKIHWLPYWINTDIFKDYQLPKGYPVLQTGVVHSRVYPWRQRVWEALCHKPYYHRVHRPPEDMERKNYWPVDSDYARLLNSAQLSVADTSKFGYSLTKLFEIPACRCVLLTDWIPEMRSLGFVPEENCLIYPDLSGDDLADWIEGWLDRPDDLGAIATAGYQLMHTRHRVACRVKKFIQILAQKKGE